MDSSAETPDLRNGPGQEAKTEEMKLWWTTSLVVGGIKVDLGSHLCDRMSGRLS